MSILQTFQASHLLYVEACGNREEVLYSHTYHQGEGACGHFTAVDLPVSVGRKAYCSIQCVIKRKSRKMLRIDRKKSLGEKNKEDDTESQYVKNEHIPCISLPGFFEFRGCSNQSEYPPFNPGEWIL